MLNKQQKKFLYRYGKKDKTIYRKELSTSQLNVLKSLKTLHFIQPVNSVTVLTDNPSDLKNDFSYKVTDLGKKYIVDKRIERVKQVSFFILGIVAEKIIDYLPVILKFISAILQ